MSSPEDFIIRRQCTPFCEPKCKYAGHHHRILVSIINCVDDKGYNEFTKTIAKFVKKGWNIDDPIADPDPEFRYPLIHWATVLGNVMVLKWCVEEPRLNLNKRWGQRSETALHRLMVCGYSALRENTDNILKTFKKLVKLLGFLLRSKDDNRDLPIHVAAKILVERPLMSDSRFDGTYTEMLKILLKMTCKRDVELLNCRNNDGNTVMHIVAQHDKGAEIVEMLLENGADCDLPNSEGLKPIDIARARDATDVIGLLSKNDEDLGFSKNDEELVSSKNDDDYGLEEIGDIDIIYIESDDDVDRNNNDDNDDAYIRNLLERVKSEPDDGNDIYEVDDTNDPDWNFTDMDASTSNETLLSADEDSFDIDMPVISSSQAKPMGNNLNSKNSLATSKKPKCDLKRKFSDKETLKESLAKKSKAATVQRKESKAVSPKLEIQLNKTKFKSLKRKIREEATGARKAAKGLFGFSSSPDKTPTPKEEIPPSQSTSQDEFVEEILESSQSFAQKSNSATVTIELLETVEEQSGQGNKCELSSSETTRTLPGMCADEMREAQDQLLNYLPSSRVKDPLPTATPANPSPDVKSSEEIPQSVTSQEVSLALEDSQCSFNSSEEIRSAWQRINGKIAGCGTLKLNLSQLSEVFDILKPVKTRIEQSLCTSSPASVEQDSLSPSPSSTENDSSTSTEKLLTTEKQRSSPIPGLIERKSNRSTPSPHSTDQHRPRKRIEDVITSLRERKQAGISSRRESCESISSTESNATPTGKKEQSNSIVEKQAETAKSHLTSDEKSDSKSEQQTVVRGESDEEGQILGSSTSVTNNEQANDQGVSPLQKQNHKSMIPGSNVVIKKEVDNTQYGGKCSNDRSKTDQTQPAVCTSAASQAAESESSQTTASNLANKVGGKKGAKKKQRIPRNALPTQVQSGSYRAMIPGGASTPTTMFEKPSSEAASTDTPAHDSGDGGETYQPLQSLTREVEKITREVTDGCPSISTADNNLASDYDPLFNVIDKICEEVYGISSGPQRSKEKQSETTKQAESTVQSNPTAAPEPKINTQIKIKKEPGVEDTESQTVTHGEILETSTSQNESGGVGRGAAGLVQSDTTQGQAVTTQNQPLAFQPVTQPPQSTMQNQTQVPNFAQEQQLLTNVRQNACPGQPLLPLRYLLLQSQPSGLIQESQRGVRQQGLSSNPQPQLLVHQPQTQGQVQQLQTHASVQQRQAQELVQRLLTHPSAQQLQTQPSVQQLQTHGQVQQLQTQQSVQYLQVQGQVQQPQTDSSVQQLQPSGQVRPEHVIPRPVEGQGVPLAQINRRILTPEQTQYLNNVQHRFRTAAQGTVNQISANNARRQVNSQNVAVTQQNITRPANMRRPHIPLENRGTSQLPPWNVSRPVVIPRNNNTGARYVTQNNTRIQVPRNLLGRPNDPHARQPTLEQVTQYLYLQTRTNPQTIIQPQQIQQSTLVQTSAATQSNLSEEQVQVSNQIPVSNLSHANVQRNLTATQIRPSNPAAASDGRLTTRSVPGPDMETAMANQINQDPTNRSGIRTSAPASLISANLSTNTVSTLQSGGNGVSNPSSEKHVYTVGKYLVI